MGAKENCIAFLFLFFLNFFFLSRSCIAIDTVTINSTHYLRDGDTIISEDGSFKLGFFSPGNSTNRYVGIWFAQVTEQTVVWVANRENPLTNSSGVFKIGKDGNLVVLDGMENVLWSSNASVLDSNISVGELLDSGNLILRGDSNSSDSIFWQSFDYPSNTFLAGMKFGLNLKTGENQLLTSWKSDNDPSPGNFSLGFDPNGIAQILIWDSSNRYWRSGQWNGQLLTGVPEMTSYHLYGFNIITDEDEGRLYCTYSNINKSIISSFVLSNYGELERLYWNNKALAWDVVWSQPNSECETYDKCGPHGSCDRNGIPICSCLPGFKPSLPGNWNSGNWSGGCVRKTQLDCKENNGKSRDGFLKLPGMKLPDNSKSVSVESTEACEGKCKSNCSCIAFSYETGLGCLTWDDDLKDIQKFPEGGQDLYIRLSQSDLRSVKKKDMKKLTFVVVGIVLGVIMLVLYALLLWRWIRRKRALRKEHSQELHFFSDLGTRKGSSRHYLDGNELEEGVKKGKGPDLPLFGLDMLRVATNDFSIENKLGEGGFGPVYKGKLPSGQEIAVKRLSKGSGQGLMEFENEVILIAKLQHRNLVRLLGCCMQGEEKLLIYEYMPNKSLDAFLFDPIKRALLDWRKRFYIIEGIARGLLYLHRDSRLRIIHRDLKASNILLDGEMNPKISDFGMARIFGGNENQANNTMRVVGTYGYMSPEYAMEGLFSVKSDVFSFGVLLLEIVSGKRNASFYHPEQPLNLLGYAWELWKENKMLDLVDPSLHNLHSTTEVSRCIQVGLLCVQDGPTDRPTMDSVVFMLSSEVAVLPTPQKPAFSLGRTPRETALYANSSEICSANTGTVSMVFGR